MTRWIDHLAILPVLLPLAAGALLIPVDERWQRLKTTISICSAASCLVVALVLLGLTDTQEFGSAVPSTIVYRLGGWPAPFGIVLIVDRLSAMMLVLASVLALASLVFSVARWRGAGSHFHSLFQFLIMGLNGAFLTGDLFNLFVFFEILLAASYGLVLHGSGRARVHSGLHYIAVNLVASSLFLVGVSLIYGVTGTLNMADIAARIPGIEAGDRGVFEAGAALLGVAFLAKAGMWPLSFWLPPAYSAAAPPMAAFFAIMTKVGVYIVLRLSLLFFGVEAGASAQFGSVVLISGGIATVIFGSIGVLASQDLTGLASHCVLISSGTLLAVIGMGDTALIEAALFYLVSSTLAISAFFMLTELTERGRAAGADVLAVTMEAYGETDEDDVDEGTEVGIAIPATMAVLGLSFVACALLLAGLPPLSGFVAKILILKALLQSGDQGTVTDLSWTLMVIVLLSGFAAVIAMTRAGIRTFWLPLDGTLPRVRVIEIAPVVSLILLCLALTLQAGPVMRFIQATAESQVLSNDYIHDVLSSNSRPTVNGRGP